MFIYTSIEKRTQVNTKQVLQVTFYAIMKLFSEKLRNFTLSFEMIQAKIENKFTKINTMILKIVIYTTKKGVLFFRSTWSLMTFNLFK